LHARKQRVLELLHELTDQDKILRSVHGYVLGDRVSPAVPGSHL
jgi:hypothetical protein